MIDQFIKIFGLIQKFEVSLLTFVKDFYIGDGKLEEAGNIKKQNYCINKTIIERKPHTAYWF